MNLPKASESLSCPSHGLRLGTPKDGECSLCQRTCPGCGGTKDTIGMQAALAGAGDNHAKMDPHRNCNKDLQSFWIKRPV